MSDRKPRRKAVRAVPEKLRGVARFVDIRHPGDSDPPILPPSIRAAVHQWMTEIFAEAELADVDVEPRRTAMLSGPPGCGKTTLAHHLAARLGRALVIAPMDQLRSKYVGETGQQIARLFTSLADAVDECVLFLDEFDAIATVRGGVEQASDREANAIVDSLLGRVENYAGMMIAATNRADVVDPALWRRFGLHLEIPMPGDDERFAIIVRYLAPFTLPDESIDVLSDLMAGASPALLRQAMEGVKRNLVLAPRLRLSTAAGDVFERIVASVQPHSEADKPLLWSDFRYARSCLASLPWPPAPPKPPESGDDDPRDDDPREDAA